MSVRKCKRCYERIFQIDLTAWIKGAMSCQVASSEKGSVNTDLTGSDWKCGWEWEELSQRGKSPTIHDLLSPEEVWPMS